MKKLSVITLSFMGSLFLGLAFLVSCNSNQGVVGGTGPATTATVSQTFTQTITRKADDRYKGYTLCKDETDGHTCRTYCDNIYKGNKRTVCKAKATIQVEKLQIINQNFDEPTDDKLTEISYPDSSADIQVITALDVGTYISISARPLETHVRGYGSRTSERVLLWIINNEEIANVFLQYTDEEDSIQRTLLQKFGGSGSNTETQLKKNTRSERNPLIETAINYSPAATKWLTDYIWYDSVCTAGNNNGENENCFKLFCKIGKAVDSDVRNDWFGSVETFESYLDDYVILNGINASEEPAGTKLRYATSDGDFCWLQPGDTDCNNMDDDNTGIDRSDDRDRSYANTGYLYSDWVQNLCEYGEDNFTTP